MNTSIFFQRLNVIEDPLILFRMGMLCGDCRAVGVLGYIVGLFYIRG